MKIFILDMLKGMVMGIANIIPGVSGGTMAVSMGIYDKLIGSVTHLFKEFKKSILTLLPIGIGMVIGIIGLSFIIEDAFEYFPIQTNLFFIGLILGGLPMIYGRVKGNKIQLRHVVAFLIMAGIVIGMALVGEVDKAANVLEFNVVNCIILFFVGLIAAATMVIPGVSGSMVLMLLGYYNSILGCITGLVEALLAFDVNAVISYVLVLVPFGIGVVGGVFAIAKLIEILLNKCPIVTFWGIIGLVAASPVAIVLANDFSGLNVLSGVTGVVTFAIGVAIAMVLGKE